MSHMKLKDGMDKWIVCRVCLDQPSTGLESIFHQDDGIDLTLLIHECGGVPVKQFDRYPDKICTKCLQCLNEAYIFRKTCQHSHKRLSELIAPMDVDKGEQQRLAFVEDNPIDELELKFDPEQVNGGIKTEMLLDGDVTEEFVPERENTKSAGTEASKITSSTAMDNEKQQITSHVEEDAVENLEKRLKLEVEIDETKMISEVFHIFDKGSEHASVNDTEMCDENKAFLDEYGKLIEENKMEKAEYLDALKNEIFSNSSGDEYVPQLKKSSLRKVKVKRKELKLKRSNIQMSATSDDEFLPNSEKTFDCDVCGLTFAQNQDLRTHKNKCKTQTKERPNTCDICGKSFTIKMGLTRHKIEVHNMIDTDCNLQTYKCEICDRTFIQKSHLTIHMRTHTGERPYRCSYCPQSFAVKATCDKHHRTHTNERPYTCDICSKSFVTKYVLKNHKMGAHEMIDTDSSLKKYKCEICERTFVQKICLTIHMRTHTGERPYKCSYCPKAFADHGSRKRHHRSHTNERPYTCDVCGKSFAIKLTLKNHKIGVHNLIDTDSINIKTYKCEICERTFIQKPHLIRHMKRHNGERPCKCSFCSKSFADSGALRNHYRTPDLSNSIQINSPVASTSNQPSKSASQRSKEYRERKKLSQPIKPAPKPSTQRSKELRERQKVETSKRETENPVIPISNQPPKSASQRVKEFRERKKLSQPIKPAPKSSTQRSKELRERQKIETLKRKTEIPVIPISKKPRLHYEAAEEDMIQVLNTPTNNSINDTEKVPEVALT